MSMTDRGRGSLMAVLLGLLATPATAQSRYGQTRSDRFATGQDLPVSRRDDPQPPGQVTRSAIGQPGTRQTREQVAEIVEPLARIRGRIANRVQTRIRNRIDRSYDPQADTRSPFAFADQENRQTPVAPRR